MLKASLENVWPTVLDRNTTNDPTRNMNGLRMPFNDKITKLDNPELKKWQNEYAGIDEEHRPPKPRDAFRIQEKREVPRALQKWSLVNRFTDGSIARELRQRGSGGVARAFCKAVFPTLQCGRFLF